MPYTSICDGSEMEDVDLYDRIDTGVPLFGDWFAHALASPNRSHLTLFRLCWENFIE